MDHLKRMEIDLGREDIKIVVEENANPDYPGASVFIKRADGLEVDLALVEVPVDRDSVNLYIYEDIDTDEWTRKIELDVQDINNVEY